MIVGTVVTVVTVVTVETVVRVVTVVTKLKNWNVYKTQNSNFDLTKS